MSGHSNDKTGWQGWAEATGYSIKQLKSEVKCLIDIDADFHKQWQIDYVVESLDGYVATTNSGATGGAQSWLNDISRYIDDAFLVRKYIPVFEIIQSNLAMFMLGKIWTKSL